MSERSIERNAVFGDQGLQMFHSFDTTQHHILIICQQKEHIRTFSIRNPRNHKKHQQNFSEHCLIIEIFKKTQKLKKPHVQDVIDNAG